MLGISIYPDKSTPEEIKQYLLLAKKYGFTKVFTCLISVEESKEQITEMLTDTVHFARENGFEVMIDIVPEVLKKLGVNAMDLSYFHELGAAGIRIDYTTNGMNEALMTHNPYGLDIEINMSQDTHFINTVMDYQPNTKHLKGCFNFYPQRYTGMMMEDFMSSAKRFKELNLRTSAFVSSSSATQGPWPLMDGMPTLEDHRDLPIDVQAKHLYLLGLVDDIIISGQFASEEELKQLSEINVDKINFNLNLVDGISEVEEKIIFEGTHFLRGDRSAYLIRSIMPRFENKNNQVLPQNTQCEFKRGDVVIGNDNFGQYKAELQIVQIPIEDKQEGRNLVGTIDESELFLLDLLKPWQHFCFSKSK